MPWESSSLTGDFYFNTDRGIAVVKQKKLSVEAEKLSPTIPKSQQTTMEMELEYWKSIKNSKNPALFKAYLEQFPQGTFAALAKAKINEHERKKLEEDRKRIEAEKKRIAIEEERKRLEAEKTKIVKKDAPKVAAVKSSLVKPGTGIKSQLQAPTVFKKADVIAQDGHFVKYKSGIVYEYE